MTGATRRALASYAAAVLSLGSLVALWSLATPLGSAFDENEHFLRAASVVHGEFRPRTVHTSVGLQSVVHVREDLATVALKTKCTAFHADRPASCAFRPSTSSKIIETLDTAGRYPPAYYLFVGWPTLVARGEAAMWGVRALSAFLVSLLLASALWMLHRSRRSTLGFAVALTPSCLFLGGVVNPSGVEIAAALTLWICVLVLADDMAVSPVWPTTVAACALVLTRPLGPLFALLIVAVASLTIGFDRVRVLAADKRVWRSAIATGVAVVLQGAWLLFAGSPNLTALHRRHGSVFQAGITILTLEMNQVRSMVARFGWSETHAPSLTLIAWGIGFAVLLIIAVRARPQRPSTILFVVFAILALEMTFDLTNYRTLGFFWNGRYSLPLAVGVPVLLARGVKHREARTLDLAVVTTVGVVQLTAFLWALHRYAVGVEAAIFAHPMWEPPGGVWFVALAFVAAVLVYLTRLADLRST